MEEQITIIVNGLEEKVPRGSKLSELINLFGEGHKDLVTELNGRFVHPRDYDSIEVSPGARVEFILAAFGG